MTVTMRVDGVSGTKLGYLVGIHVDLLAGRRPDARRRLPLVAVATTGRS